MARGCPLHYEIVSVKVERERSKSEVHLICQFPGTKHTTVSGPSFSELSSSIRRTDLSISISSASFGWDGEEISLPLPPPPVYCWVPPLGISSMWCACNYAHKWKAPIEPQWTQWTHTHQLVRVPCTRHSRHYLWYRVTVITPGTQHRPFTSICRWWWWWWWWRWWWFRAHRVLITALRAFARILTRQFRPT